jgi:hypothetical protein
MLNFLVATGAMIVLVAMLLLVVFAGRGQNGENDRAD